MSLDTLQKPSPLFNLGLQMALDQIHPHPEDVRLASLDQCCEQVARALYRAGAILAGVPAVDFTDAPPVIRRHYLDHAILAVAAEDKSLVSRATSRALAAIPGRVEAELGLDEISLEDAEWEHLTLAADLMTGELPSQILRAWREERR